MIERKCPAQLQPDGSPLQVGSRGAYRGAPFEIAGRVQLQTPHGLWNDWFIVFADGRRGWLAETEGAYAVSFKTACDAPPLSGLKAFAKVEINGAEFRVLEITEAECLAAEGELPFQPPLGERATAADLIGENGAFGTIDYSETPPEACTGEYQDFDALAFAGLKAL